MTAQALSPDRSKGQRILHSALVKILIGFLLVAGMVIALQSLLEELLKSSCLCVKSRIRLFSHPG